MILIGFDPGRDKCGLAVVTRDNQVLYHQVIPSGKAIATILNLIERYHPEKIIMGNQTTSKQWQKKLTENISLKVTLVNEKNSTLEARDKYWQMYPPQGLKKLIPKGLRVPPCPIDDIVAIILIERYLQQHSNR
jgi:RNase H-fold protein (predicted Holliday junction resolvase)